MKALVEATPISAPARIGRARSLSRAIELSGHVDHRQHLTRALLAIAQRGERVGRLARLADEQRRGPFGDRRVAVAELGRDIDIHGQAGQLLEPVFRGEAGVERGAAGNQAHALDRGEIGGAAGQHDVAAILGEVMREGGADHQRLFGDLLGHEVPVPGLVDAGMVDLYGLDGPCHGIALRIGHVHALPRHHREIALFEIGDAVGHRPERDRIRADEHLALAVADGQRAALARGDQQIGVPVEQKAQRVGPVEPRDRGTRRGLGIHALGHEMLCQKRDGFGVGIGLVPEPGLAPVRRATRGNSR